LKPKPTIRAKKAGIRSQSSHRGMGGPDADPDEGIASTLPDHLDLGSNRNVYFGRICTGPRIDKARQGNMACHPNRCWDRVRLH
jgi:hypothetical protein